jgi:dipeptidyl aminopeptidase/acylaminoacyl peptidase
MEFRHALQEMKVDTQLVIYPGEGHSFREPERRGDLMRRAAFWFNRDLK